MPVRPHNAPTQSLPSTSQPVAADRSALGRLYLVRFTFAVVWAALLAVSASSLTAVAITLLVVYPSFDVLAAVVDKRTARQSGRSQTGLWVNVGVSTIAAVGVGIAAAHRAPDVLRVWGVWAVVAGLVQLAVALSRRGLGGQWAMVISGTISVIAGAGFIASASGKTDVKAIAGYAVLGGIFFLVSALRLRRAHRITPAGGVR